MSTSFFSTSLRRGPDQPRDLAARIDAQLRERVEEAVELVCLDAMVRRRRALGLPVPRADDARDRDEFTRAVRAFLERLRGEIADALSETERRKVREALDAGGDGPGPLLAVQVALAKELPDYWQRFDGVRARYTGEEAASSGERRGLLGHLFGH